MEVFKKIETDRLIIRPLSYKDKPGFISLMTNSAITQNLAFDDAMKTAAGALIIFNKTIESYETENHSLAYAIESKPNNKFIGICGISPVYENSVEIFYAFLPDYWGKGFATETLIKLRDHLVNDTGVKKIHAYIRPTNIASVKVAEKAKFAKASLVDKEYFAEKVYDYTFSN